MGCLRRKRPVSLLEQLFFLPEEECMYRQLTPGEVPERNGEVLSAGLVLPHFYFNLKILDVDPEAVMSRMSFGQQKKVMIASGWRRKHVDPYYGRANERGSISRPRCNSES